MIIDFKINNYETQIAVTDRPYGILHTDLIRFYWEFDSRFHKLAIFLKFWVAQNNAKLEFTKKFKLNSFSLVCMLIVYLQDVENPPVLPKIKTCDEEGLILENLDHNLLEECFEKFQDYDINNKSLINLYRGFIDFYFNGKFNYLTDVINTAHWWIESYESVEQKVMQGSLCPSNLCDEIQKNKFLNELKNAIFGIIDPFDHTYSPSLSFGLRPSEKDDEHKTTLPKLRYFIEDIKYNEFLLN